MSHFLNAAIFQLGFNEAHAGHLPLQGSDIAASWDQLYMFLIWLSLFFFILVVGGMVYLAVEYRRQKKLKIKYITGSHMLEAVWIFVPTVLLMVIFAWGFKVYHEMVQAPSDSYEVRVLGKQWLWTFQYDNGRTTVGDVFIPVNRPVKFIMTSEDVLHSFFIPNFRVKQDVVPGMYTSVWVEAKVPGKHQIYCAEYCGTTHSGMLANLNVLNDEQWKAWNAGKKLGEIPEARDPVAATEADQVGTSAASPIRKGLERETLAAQGRRVFETRGCIACHTTDGSSKTGPTHKGLFGSEVTFIDGSKVKADENYIRESIEKPNARIVRGFSPVMPTFQGLVSETEMNALIAFIKSAQ